MGKYPKPGWAVQQIVRSSGLVEDICKHGCGHPNAAWLQENTTEETSYISIHGCDGCCVPNCTCGKHDYCGKCGVQK